MRRLRYAVHFYDDGGRLRSFAPGDDVPEWAAARITNPKAWLDSGEHVGPAEDVAFGPGAPGPKAGTNPAPRKPRRSSGKGRR